MNAVEMVERCRRRQTRLLDEYDPLIDLLLRQEGLIARPWEAPESGERLPDVSATDRVPETAEGWA